MSKSQRSLCVSFSRTGAGLYICHLSVWSNLNFLHISQWITLPTQSCLVLYFFCANLLHSLMMWLMVLLLLSLLFYTFESPSTLADGFPLDCEWQQFSWTLLSILADLNNAVVWMVSTRPRISKSSSPSTDPLVTVPSALITIGIIVNFLFHGFFSSRARSKNLSFFSLSFSFTERRCPLFGRFSFFIDYYEVWSSGHQFVSQNPEEFCVSNFQGQILGCVYTICSYGEI